MPFLSTQINLALERYLNTPQIFFLKKPYIVFWEPKIPNFGPKFGLRCPKLIKRHFFRKFHPANLLHLCCTINKQNLIKILLSGFWEKKKIPRFLKFRKIKYPLIWNVKHFYKKFIPIISLHQGCTFDRQDFINIPRVDLENQLRRDWAKLLLKMYHSCTMQFFPKIDLN